MSVSLILLNTEENLKEKKKKNKENKENKSHCETHKTQVSDSARAKDEPHRAGTYPGTPAWLPAFSDPD